MDAEQEPLSDEAEAILDSYRTIKNRKSKTKYSLHAKEIYEALSGTITEEKIRDAIKELHKPQGLHKAGFISGTLAVEPGDMLNHDMEMRSDWGLTDEGKKKVFPEEYLRQIRD